MDADALRELKEELAKLRQERRDMGKEIYNRIEAVESRLEERCRIIENESRDRDSQSDKALSSLEAKVDLHISDMNIHKKPVGTATLYGFKGQQQSQVQRQSDEWAAAGVPWWANPKWWTAIGLAIATIVGALAMALKDWSPENKENKPDGVIERRRVRD